ncbi:iron-containing alcohol dehydrogenase [Halalkalibacterium halodurans]|uniref:NADH-dependent butanol dehydrogenase n=1 Tax=Halalkalibacterium halodurans (strain ATCC BAA-125 / DSM 18197 / FERM 7344 / JCM 9153 / C-125) TaxID=272558 RepID=Q9K7L7_HALH5|nr:iron-containing alcohol dehydrogenase [Halalkalibacterium halodurans]MDY7223876.1 iron-containing alcohol dehydrogenase [Halalkalibacterium halodurans]MDY7243097.1 iron-containing alcohol dehydrogenase [Halalkalibacterium halodurans]MED4080620.1 iron-containing alcohol dehydrogenase [Halalkalibacterium halodurans]MED4085693.1 iron-containing alcohol dehydrogenase [Halalkalibacterium halodurans]MED4106307.1 iron-containing alcohol dehydrogenase [Halalkalibacterium halodurans]
MNPFMFKNPTKLVFGVDQTNQLEHELTHVGKNVLLVYGGGSIKRNGLYDRVLEQLERAGKAVIELSGVEPNPRLTTVQKGIDLCKAQNIEFILAVGGGSVIDATKAIAAGAKYDGDVWDIITKKTTAEDALPFGTILTLAATGSEMNANSVITNWETNQKIGWSSSHVYPMFSILDPKNTVTVPKDQTIYGIVDMMSHVLESYFHPVSNTPLQDRMCEAVLQTVIETGPKLVNDLESLEYRETILYCGTMALNGVLSMGARGDWATHNIEHAVSAVYDIPHAGGLAILFPHWLTYSLDQKIDRHVQLATRVFGVDPSGKSEEAIAHEGIERLSAFWTELGAPNRLADYDIDDSQVERMAEIATEQGELGNFKLLKKQDVANILTAAL